MYYLAIAAVLLLGGCANQLSDAQVASITCAKAGLKPDTPAYDECVEHQLAQRLPSTCMRWGPRVACY